MALARVAIMGLACDVNELSKDEFRESVFRLLVLASRVESGHPYTPQLVTLLDELDSIGRGKMATFNIAAPEIIFHTNHWTRELYNIQESCEYSFMGLASAFAIAPYIETKIFSSASGKLVPRHPALESPPRLPILTIMREPREDILIPSTAREKRSARRYGTSYWARPWYGTKLIGEATTTMKLRWKGL